MIATALLLLLAAPPAPSPTAACAARGGKWNTGDFGTGCVVKGQRDGEWTREGPGGQLIERSIWVRGKRVGPSALYHSNCQVAARGEWLDGKRHGPWTFWAPDGKKLREGSYEADLETGTWISYHPELGTRHLEGPWVKGKEEGVFTEHLPTGVKWREVHFSAGLRADEAPAACTQRGGEWRVDFEERREGCLVDSLEEGIWITYDGAGVLRARTEYVKGRREGFVEDFHPTGELMRRAEHADGIPTGVHEFRARDQSLYGRSVLVGGTGRWRAFHPNGRVSEEATYQGGCIVGPWRTFNEEGRPLVEEEYRDCLRDGAVTWYHQNGARRMVGQYRAGEPVGEWRAFFSNGDPDWVGHYEHGERSGEWKYYRWGKTPRAFGTMLEGVPAGEWTEFHPTGKPSGVGEKRADAREGTWKTFWSTGEPWREVSYVGGREPGEAEACAAMRGQWTPDGEKRTLGCLVCRAREDDSVEQVGVGVWTFWHPNGAIEKQGPLREGRPHGEWRFFHDNGTEMMRGGFDGGVESGRWSGRYREGQPRFEGDYIAGRAEGVWTSWLPDGGVLSVGRYAEGAKVGAWRYEKNGGWLTLDAGTLADRRGGLSDTLGAAVDAGTADAGTVTDAGAPP